MLKDVEVYIFNPEHDMALANFSSYYKAPSEIIRMKDDLSFLPFWFSPDNALIKVYDKVMIQVLKNQTSSFGDISHSRFVDCFTSSVIVPWGWDPAIVHSLVESGISSTVLPGKEELENIRFLSSRERAAEVLESFSSVAGLCGKAFRCTDIIHVKDVIASHDDVILKSPWSGSGRGLVRISRDAWNANTEGWVSRIIRTQGCIMAEPIYNKVLDFAMEFYSDDDGNMSFVGYSLFDTDSHGNYKHNILIGDNDIEKKICLYVPLQILHQVRDRLLKELQSIVAGGYSGYFGVDMMICSEGNGFLLHPCVEINLRMNMGVVSHIIYDRFVSRLSSGRFVIEHFASDGEALSAHGHLSISHPLTIDDEGKISSGYLTLTPVVHSTRYQAYIIILE